MVQVYFFFRNKANDKVEGVHLEGKDLEKDDLGGEKDSGRRNRFWSEGCFLHVIKTCSKGNRVLANGKDILYEG